MRNLNKNPEEENEMVQDLEDVKELGKEMEQISEQNDEAFEEKKSEQIKIETVRYVSIFIFSFIQII